MPSAAGVLQRFRGRCWLVPLLHFEPKLGIHKSSPVKVFRKTEGDCSRSGIEEQGGRTFPLWVQSGKGGREQKISPPSRGCNIFQEGLGIEHEGKAENVGNFASDISLNARGCSGRV